MERNVAIIGGGLAGTACAYILKQRGYESILYEASENLAAGASGNPVGLFNPRFYAEDRPEARFYHDAFLETCQLFQKLSDIEYSSHGSLHLVTSEDKERRFTKMLQSAIWLEDEMQNLSLDDACAIAGIEVQHGGIYLPHSGTISPQKLCEVYAEECEVVLNTSINKIERLKSGWSVNGELFAHVVLACGAGVLNFEPTESLPIHTVRGQIAQVKSTEMSKNLKTNICYSGYVTPAKEEIHTCGSTFQKWLTHTNLLEEDNQDILVNLKENVPALDALEKVQHARASLRTASKDRLPIIGAVPGEQGLYLSTAHGSHGIVTTLKAAQMIADEIEEYEDSDYLSALSMKRFFKSP